MLVNLTKILALADEGHYAIGGFNMTTLESAMAVVEAGEQEDSPVILQISEKTIDYMGLDLAFAIAKTLADRAKVPVCVHFDHGRNFELVEQSLRTGFSSVMLDVSQMEKNKRIPFVKDFTLKAHRLGATVEAEEDQIGGREDYVEGDNSHFTDPKRAMTFVKETGVDAFAVSIGSTHGKPLPHERLDVELLAEINKVVNVPLVLHGASSTDEKLVREVISAGVCKINIDTDLRLAFTRELRRTLKDPDIYDPREELKPSRDEIIEEVRRHIKLFGSSGKAR
ncbi:MAG: class II fructose-bisphosphate aldolase [Candidatus Berkelbacteria bacterium]|nr:MAG: class II fructose-bisphosphate aldolase [Candidatus Berkelbacteria bacterium]QQG52020.1 MAG: class II fructose-bisphosphate aldolase [Candidatus Berkelbacteria bacterium]